MTDYLEGKDQEAIFDGTALPYLYIVYFLHINVENVFKAEHVA